MSNSLGKVAALSPAFVKPSQNRPTRVALVNIMDNAEGTERHFTRTIQKADPNAEITLCRMACAKIDPKYFRENDFLLSERYVDWHDVIGEKNFDLVIVTGIDRGTLSYDDLEAEYGDFWNESKQLFRAIQSSIRTGKTGHSALVCWSAFAAMKDLYDVEKGIHPQKFYGLFPHTIQEPRHPLVNGFADKEILVPHSRSSYMNDDHLRETIDEHCGKVVLNGPDGPSIWTLENDRMTCFINHLEYSIDTLHREYQRDRKNRCPNFPAPQNYNYNPDGENSELETIFEELSSACDHFYTNLLKIAKEQGDAANAPKTPTTRVAKYALLGRKLGITA